MEPFYRVVLNGTVEIAEEHDQQEVQNSIEPALGIKQIEEGLRTVAGILDEHLDRRRKRENGACEDDGHNAGDVDLDGKVRALAAVHLASNDTFCIDNRDSSLGVVEPNDKYNHACHKDIGNRNKCVIESASLELLMEDHDVVRETGYDTGEKKNGDTVADTLLIDFLTHPHKEGGTGRQGKNNNQRLKDRGKSGKLCAVRINREIAVASQIYIVCGGLKKGQDNCNDSCNDLQFFPSRVALFGHSLQSRNSDSQELNDDGRVDVWGDGHCKQGAVLECVTSHHVQIVHKVACRCGVGDNTHGSIGERNTDGCTDPEQKNDKCREENLLPDFRCLKRIDERLQHVRPPRPFRRQLRSSPSLPLNKR